MNLMKVKPKQPGSTPELINFSTYQHFDISTQEHSLQCSNINRYHQQSTQTRRYHISSGFCFVGFGISDVFVCLFCFFVAVFFAKICYFTASVLFSCGSLPTLVRAYVALLESVVWRHKAQQG
jgi:hypothetical protein